MIRSSGSLTCALLLGAARVAFAQPTPPAEPVPLAPVRDDAAVTAALRAIVQDPAIPVSDPAQRTRAQGLMLEGLNQLESQHYDQALANFLEAYGTFPSPKILLNIASTLRDMGRFADAANTYQRYLLDPATGPERVAEVKALLLRLDEQLTILTIRVTPRGSELSLDAGPFIAVGTSLQTRVRPGIHLVRVRSGAQTTEQTVNGFDGEVKEVTATVVPAPVVTAPAVAEPAAAVERPTVAPQAPPAVAPDHVEAWLVTGTQYGSDGGTSNVRQVRAGYSGPVVAAIVPTFQTIDGGDLPAFVPEPEHIHSGVLAILRVDGKLRGAAGGLGLAIARGHVEGEVLVLRSSVTGGYLGGRYRFLTGFLRPYVGAGVPGFVYDNDAGATKLAIGMRIAAGVEIVVNGHISVQGDVGYEHFFGIANTQFEPDVVVPTIGIIGRL